MDIEELFRNRVSESQVAEVLQVIATTPNKRQQPIDGDLAGKFDFWFDGGACCEITGWCEYELTDGTRVMVSNTPALSITIELSNGARVKIQQNCPGVDVPWTGLRRLGK